MQISEASNLSGSATSLANSTDQSATTETQPDNGGIYDVLFAIYTTGDSSKETLSKHFVQADLKQKLKELGHEDPNVRDRAQRSLQKQGSAVVSAVEEAGASSADFEVRTRSQQIISFILKADPTAGSHLKSARMGTVFTEQFDETRARKLISDLQVDDFGVRVRAYDYLCRMGRQVLPLLEETKAKSNDLETKKKSSEAIKWIERNARFEEEKSANLVLPPYKKLFSIVEDMRNEMGAAQARKLSHEDHKEIEQMLRLAEKVVTNPGFRPALRKEANQFNEGTASQSEKESYLRRSVIRDAHEQGKYLYARVLSNGNAEDRAKARRLLTEHIDRSPDETNLSRVLLTAVAADAHKDPKFLAAFRRNQGNAELLKFAIQSVVSSRQDARVRDTNR